MRYTNFALLKSGSLAVLLATMKRQRAGSAEGMRRPRLYTAPAEETADPIAAAAQAKREREGSVHS